jgi:hypothetical protein
MNKMIQAINYAFLQFSSFSQPQSKCLLLLHVVKKYSDWSTSFLVNKNIFQLEIIFIKFL